MRPIVWNPLWKSVVRHGGIGARKIKALLKCRLYDIVMYTRRMNRASYKRETPMESGDSMMILLKIH